MTTIEEAREQARETLADYHRVNAGGYGAGNHTYLARALSALLDATEPPANVTDRPKSDIPAGQMSVKYADGDIVADTAARIACQNSELMARLADKPAEDEREALAQCLIANRARGHGIAACLFDPWEMAEALLAAGYRKWPRPITEEMVKATARTLNLKGWTCDGGADEPGNYDECEDCQRCCDGLARAALEAAEEARR